MRIVCYYALFVIFEKAAKFVTVICCKLHGGNTNLAIFAGDRDGTV